MASPNAYAAYKRDNRYLLHWMINTSNSIIKRLSSQGSFNDISLSINSMGETTVAELVIMSKMIASHVSPIPTIVYRLLKSVIKARVAAYTFFVETAAENQEPEVEEQNASHKYFIDALEEILRNLGGENWSETKAQAHENNCTSIEQVAPTNKFTALQLDGADDEQDQSDDPYAQQTQGTRQPRPRKSKGNRKNISKKKRPQESSKAEHSLESVPLESCRIIEGSEGTVAEYLVAVHDLLTECVTLRQTVQHFWRQVAYNRKHIAVAGAVSNAAIAMIRRASSELFVDFPGHDSFETIIHTITHGRGINALCNFPVAFHNDGATIETKSQDVREQLSTYVYHDLLDFIHDFQKTHSGKPTKQMLKQIANWDPHADPQQLSQEERRRWCRSYTINWLYDLVNVFRGFADGLHSTVKDLGRSRGEANTVDTRHLPSPLYGVNEFAGFVVSLVKKSYGTDISTKILPHHVFQLQCMVDSMAVSRGCFYDAASGDIVEPPPIGFNPRRSLDSFLWTGSSDYFEEGFLPTATLMMDCLAEDPAHCCTARGRRSYALESLEILHTLFKSCLGKNSAIELDYATSPSRFDNTNPHGLWHYSPFTCGVGLLEALELAYLAGMAAWTYTPEVRIMIHLYNKLVLKSYIKTPIKEFEFLLKEFAGDFFANGRRPTSIFESCFMASVRKFDQDRASSACQCSSLLSICFNSDWLSRTNLHNTLSCKSTVAFKRKLITHHLRAADWDAERIPDNDIPIPSMLALSRLNRNMRNTPNCASSGKSQLLDRLHAGGTTTAQISDLTVSLAGIKSKLAQRIPDISEFAEKWANDHAIANSLTCHETICMIGLDVGYEVESGACLLNVNYLSIAMQLKASYLEMVEILGDLKNPLHEAAFRGPMTKPASCRELLARLALRRDDEECLRTMADVIERAPCLIPQA